MTIYECVWHAQVSLPPKLNPFMCNEDLDVEWVSTEDSEDSESGSDLNYVPSSSESSNTSTDSEPSSMEVDPPLQPDEDDLSILTSWHAAKWCKQWLSTTDSETLVMTRWCDALQNYHFCPEASEVSYILATIVIYSNYMFETAKASLGERQEAAVTALQEMKAVLKKYYDNNSWRRKVKV